MVDIAFLLNSSLGFVRFVTSPDTCTNVRAHVLDFADIDNRDVKAARVASSTVSEAGVDVSIATSLPRAEGFRENFRRRGSDPP